MTRRGALIWLVLIAAFAVLSRWQIRDDRRCALCGMTITPVYQVDLVVDGRAAASFCTLGCASRWPETPSDPTWLVRDEVTGEIVDSSRALYVDSPVYSVPEMGEKVHVFARSEDALESIGRYGGKLIPSPLEPPGGAHEPAQAGQP